MDKDKTLWNYDAFLIWCNENGIDHFEDQETHWPGWKAAYIQGVTDCWKAYRNHRLDKLVTDIEEEKEKLKRCADAFDRLVNSGGI